MLKMKENNLKEGKIPANLRSLADILEDRNKLLDLLELYINQEKIMGAICPNCGKKMEENKLKRKVVCWDCEIIHTNEPVKPKYTFTNETMRYNGVTVRRIVINGIEGGFIEHEGNLSQDGLCSVQDNAIVYGNATVKGDAIVCDNAVVSGNATVEGNAKVCEASKIFGNAIIKDKAYIAKSSYVYENAQVYGTARLYGAEVFGNAKVFGKSELRPGCKIFGDCTIHSSSTWGTCVVSSKAVLSKSFIDDCKIEGALVMIDSVVSNYTFNDDMMKRFLPEKYKFSDVHKYYHAEYNFMALKHEKEGWLIRTPDIGTLRGTRRGRYALYKAEDLFRPAYIYEDEFRNGSRFHEQYEFYQWALDKLWRYGEAYRFCDFKDIKKLDTSYYI